MAHVMKSTAGACGGLLAHYERQLKEDGTHRQYGNQEIDLERTYLNYNLGPERDGGQLGFIKQRASEVKCLKRADVNVMCSWVITAPEGLATRIEHREKQRPLLHFDSKEAQDNLKLFFEESYKFLNDRYGHGADKNVISAYVHMDETTPHMHYAFVPVVVDREKGHEKVSAYEAVNRTDLQKFHTDLEKHMGKIFGREIGIMNEATKDGNKTVEELKRETKIIQSEVREHRSLKTNIKELDKAPKSIKIPFTDKSIVLENAENRQNITEQAKGYIANRDKMRDMRKWERHLDTREKDLDGWSENLDKNQKKFDERESELAEKEKQVDAMYNTQLNLNQRYEQKTADFDDLWERYTELETDTEAKLKQAQNTISILRGQNGTLQTNLSQVRVDHQKEIETLSSGLKTQLNDTRNNMSQIIANMAMAIGSAKHHDEYRIPHLTEKEGRFIDAISNYAESWLRDFGYQELAEEVRTKVSVSKGIHDHMQKLEPKRQIDRGYDLGR